MAAASAAGAAAADQHHDDGEDVGYSRTVNYTNSAHSALIFQRWGSVHHKVMPFCLLNVGITLVLVILLHFDIDLTISEFGHEFMSVLVAFLVINKLSFTLGLYYEYQGYLSKMNQSSIEVTQLVCSFTHGYDQNEYKKWRFKVALHTLTLLKATVFVIYKSGEERAWEVPELDDDEPLKVDPADTADKTVGARADSGYSGQAKSSNKKKMPRFRHRHHSIPAKLYIWGRHLHSDKNLRTPIVLAQRLRNAITAHRKLPQDPIDTIREQMLLNCVKEFMDAYHGVRKYLTCPLPLPIVQLGRLFVLFYCFTMPFALLNPDLHLKPIQISLLIFIMTYGFMGIELLFVEIDDPFAEEPNDLPLTEEAKATGQDIFLLLSYIDGEEEVEKLRMKFRKKTLNLLLDNPREAARRQAAETDPLI